MKRALKIIVVIIAVIIVLLAAALIIITQVINPNDFKPQIRQQAYKEANLNLKIPGDLSWQFWPSLGVSLGRTEARIAGHEQLFAAIDSADVSVAVWPLLFGKVEMNGVNLDGLELNLKKTAEGANWQQIGPRNKSERKEKTTTNQPEAGSESKLNIPLTIPSVAITNGKVRYQDTTSATDIRVQHFNFHASDVNFDNSFPVKMSLRYQDQNDIRVDLNLKATIDADLNANHYVLKPMTLDAEVAGATANPVKVHLQQDLDVNLDKDSVNITDLVLQAAGTETTGHVAVSGLTGPISVTGEVHTAPFDANEALQAIGEKPIKTRDKNALANVALDATLDGKPGSIMLSPLKVTLDQSTIDGSAGLASLDSGKVVFDLKLDKIALDHYLSPDNTKADKKEKPSGAGGSKAGKHGGTAQLAERPLIPVDSLRPLNLDGRFRIGQLSYQDINAQDLVFKVAANDGVLKLTQASGKALNGQFNADASIDASGSKPVLHASTQLSDMQIQPIAQLASGRDLAKGILDLKANFQASGNSEKALVDSARGSANIDLADGVVRGLNLYNTLIGGVNDLLGRFQGLSSLIPNQESGKLPRILSEDTRIIDLTTRLSLKKQVAHIDKLQAKLDKGTISGQGWLNTLTRDFDLNIGMQSPELGGGKYLHDVTWPLECSGSLAGNPAKWCGPDRAGFRDIAKQAAANATRARVEKKLGINAKGDTTEEVLKNAAKQRAEEEINKKLGDKLKGLLH